METNSEEEGNGGGAGALEETPMLHKHLAYITKEIRELNKREGESVPHFVEELLQRELTLPEGTGQLIQQADRAVAWRLEPREMPQSKIVNFLRFDTKEMILKQAWQKLIKLNNIPLFFDHDYPTEVVQKHKAYTKMKL
ncbi:uncharacterized protein AKAME5_001058300 [Lates japonicus]|uniref:Uncharacterized protein n=1 Tax=Lates japonicus TaxID=270547 RepID=A0AAD3MSA4_LATJO|nr:uncharacterized protein AKAME5_001058300 [Lates japonicus]